MAALRRQRRAARTSPGATATSYEPTAADEGKTLRVAVLAGNWISSVSQAFSAPTAVVAPTPKPADAAGATTARGGAAAPRAGSGLRLGRHGAPAQLRLTRVKMTPRRFAVSHRRAPKGTQAGRHAGLVAAQPRRDRAADVPAPHAQGLDARRRDHPRGAKAGNGELRFRGRFGKRLLKPQRYRLVISAARGRRAHRRTPPRLPGPQGMSDGRIGRGGSGAGTRTSRRSRSRASRSAALRAELVLLREENARLKAAPHQAPDIARLLGRARSLPTARVDDDSVADETTRVLIEGLVIRESLLEICQEIERAMVSFEARLKALESTGSLRGRARA